MGPFSPSPFPVTPSTRVTAGVAAANVQLQSSGNQAVLVTPSGNVDSIYITFSATQALAAGANAAVIPVAGGVRGGMEILPNSMIEITIPSNLPWMSYISGTAAQRLTVVEGADV